MPNPAHPLNRKDTDLLAKTLKRRTALPRDRFIGEGGEMNPGANTQKAQQMVRPNAIPLVGREGHAMRHEQKMGSLVDQVGLTVGMA